jgi:hypothetical protein
MNIYETPQIRKLLLIYKHLPSDVHLTKEMLDKFLKPEIIKYYELCLRARRQNRKFFTITDSDFKIIITQTYLNILKQIDRGQKPIIANKIRELFGMITYNVMSQEVKDRSKYKYEYIENMEVDILDDQVEDVEEIREQQENNHKLYLEVMEIAQGTLTKTELDCFVFKYYSNYTNKEIQILLGLSNINKVSMIINQAELKLKEATKNIKMI